jgi:hypothetical protein
VGCRALLYIDICLGGFNNFSLQSSLFKRGENQANSGF